MSLARPTSIASLLALLVLAGAAAGQTTWYVDAGGVAPGSGTLADPYTSIQHALDQATTVDGDTVLAAPGTYVERVDFLGKAVAVRSTGGPSVTTIDASNVGSVVSFVSGEGPQSLLQGFAITRGTGARLLPNGPRVGGGIRIAGSASPTIVDCDVHGNHAMQGGGIWIGSGAPTFRECSVWDNSSGLTSQRPDGAGGGVYALGSSGVLFDHSGIEQNFAQTGAGACFVDADVRMLDTLVADNFADSLTADARGAGVHQSGGMLEMLRCRVEGNEARGFTTAGGGLYLTGTTGLEDTEVRDNVSGGPTGQSFSGFGGGIYNVGQLHALRCQVVGNCGPIGGGNVYGVGDFVECRINRGESQFGGGVRATSPALTLTDCRIRHNLALSTGSADFGGGVYGPAVLTRCDVANNVAYGEGGGVHGATLVDCEVYANRTLPSDVPSSAGAGAYGAMLTGCRVYDNEAVSGAGAEGEGGGAAQSTLVSCALFDNRAARGAGAHQSSLDRCTLFANVAAIAGGGLFGGSAVSSILWNDVGGEVAGGAAVTYSDVEGGDPGVGNLNADPLFWCPDFRDFFLLPGSPCIDQGAPGTTDPDGSPRDQGAHPFDAAHELQPTLHCAGKPSSLGCVPTIETAGTPSLTSAAPFLLEGVDAIPGQPAILVYGYGRTARMHHGGQLCVRVPLRRLLPPVVAAATGTPPCSGRLTADFNAHIQSGADPALVLGQPVVAQWIQLDPADPAGFGDSLSRAVSFVVCP